MTRALVVGLGVSGAAVARHLRARGIEVLVVDDDPVDATHVRARELGVDLVQRPSAAQLAPLVDRADLIVPSPGVPARHPALVLAASRGVPVRSEIELAAAEARCPVVAVTGTNGKTTVTTLVTDMLSASGLRAEAAGNIGRPLIDAVETDAEVIVAEVSSFQLEFTDAFHPRVAVWLNAAEDHLDWHLDFDAYIAAKARIWARQAGDDLAVVNADDPVVVRAASTAPARVETFGVGPGASGPRSGEQGPSGEPGRSGNQGSRWPHWHVAGGVLRTPDGEAIVEVATLDRALPHDVANALAATAAALGAGATLLGARVALRRWATLPHRVALVGDAGGVRWYDDSKATNPHAALAAIGGFESVVLIAGGRNKGLDLSVLARAAKHIRAVVAIGEAGPDVEHAFSEVRPVQRADSMTDAVRVAATLAQPGDAVLLSPACASYDRYRSYAERGEDFARAVREHLRGHSRD